MASACALEWVPDSLYNTAVSATVSSYSRHRRDVKSLPEDVQFDIYYKVSTKFSTCWITLVSTVTMVHVWCYSKENVLFFQHLKYVISLS